MKNYTGKIIDAHHHLWDLSLNKHSWLIGKTENNHLGDDTKMRRSYLIHDYLKDIELFQIEKSVHIQAGWDRADVLGESQELEKISQENGFPNAIVAYADLSNKNVEELLIKQSQISSVQGIRQILNWHEDPFYTGCDKNYLTMEEWRKNFGLLQKYQLSFDLQIYPEQVDEAYPLLKQHDEIKTVISHALMPAYRGKAYLNYWRKQLKKLSILPNVYIKISGLAMFDHAWTLASFREIIIPVVETFSPTRCMIGSNFPVDKLYGSYEAIMSAYIQILSRYSDNEQKTIFYDTAERFYNLT